MSHGSIRRPNSSPNIRSRSGRTGLTPDSSGRISKEEFGLRNTLAIESVSSILPVKAVARRLHPSGLPHSRDFFRGGDAVHAKDRLGSSAGLALFAALTAMFACNGSSAMAASCESLASLSLPNAKITLAQNIAPGAFTPPGAGGIDAAGAPAGALFSRLPAFCRVAVTLTPSSDSDIKIEVWLPASGWNGKFQAVGNGGWAGFISYNALALAVAGSYATVSTDTGHTGNTGTFAF